MNRRFVVAASLLAVAGTSKLAAATFDGPGDAVGAMTAIASVTTQTTTEESPDDDPVDGAEADDEEMESGETPDYGYAYGNPGPEAVDYTELPDEFRRPNPPAPEPTLSVSNIKRMYLRDFPGVRDVLRLSVVRDPGALWKIRKDFNGNVIYLDAAITIHDYLRLIDGRCLVTLESAYVRKPYIGYGHFGAPEVASMGSKGQEVPCDWK